MSKWLYIPAQGSANDWDTYSIAVSNEFVFLGGTYVNISTTPSGTNFAPGQYREGFQSGFVSMQVRQGNISDSYQTDVPWLAIWNVTQSSWIVVPWWNGQAGTVQSYFKGNSEPAGTATPSVGDTLRVVGLSQYTSGDVASWNNYA